MIRRLRVYQKKRGHRRTGSRTLGTLGEALFFGFFLLVGLGATSYVFLALVWPEMRANRHFLPAECTVLDTRVAESPGAEGATYRPEVQIRYQVDGETFVVWTYDVLWLFAPSRERSAAALTGFEIGRLAPCWYDPLNPQRAVVARGYSGWLYLVLLIPLSFLAIGVGGLIYNLSRFGTSVERRAVLDQRSGGVDLFEQEPEVHPDYPTVPADANLRNSPGTKLTYRLPTVTAPAWRLFAVLVACLLWNGIVGFFVIMALRSHLRGEPNWLLSLFIVPFVVAGLGLVVYLLRQLLRTTGVGVTRLEISELRLQPGGCYEVLLSQDGRLTLQELCLLLVCDEAATYHQGTDARSETRRVFEQPVFRSGEFEVQQGRPFEQRCVLQIPAGAMHSFQADHNAVRWRLLVRGRAEGWPDFERAFPIIVLPENGRAPR